VRVSQSPPRATLRLPSDPGPGASRASWGPGAEIASAAASRPSLFPASQRIHRAVRQLFNELLGARHLEWVFKRALIAHDPHPVTT
jgi:hypothetical protein